MVTYNENLEKLYLPSKWSPRLPPEEIVEKHVEFCKSASKDARETIPSSLNIPYGSLEKEEIDIFGTDLPNGAPVFAFVHGGYWQEVALGRDTYHFIASNLYKNGIKSIFIGYELCPKVSLPKIIEEIEIATKKCINYAKENNSRGLFFAGYSAGSHLVAAIFTNLLKNLNNEERGFIKAAFLMAGIYDLSEIPKTSVNEPLKLSEEEAVGFSPYKQDVKCVSTKFYVIAAENDSPEFKKQSKDFYEKLLRSKLNASFLVVDNVDHFDVVESLIHEDFQVTQLILNEIK